MDKVVASAEAALADIKDGAVVALRFDGQRPGAAAVGGRTPWEGTGETVELRLTARDLLELGLIDGVIPEPNGGAQNDWDESAANLDKGLQTALGRLKGLTPKELVDHRYEKFRKIGSFFEG